MLRAWWSIRTHAAGPQDAAPKMIAEERFAKGLFRVPTSGVPAAPVPHQSPPCTGMIAIHPATFEGRLIKIRKHMDSRNRARVSMEAVPLIRSWPSRGKHARRLVRAILHDDGCGLHGWMTDEPRTDHVREPRPIMLRVACRMDASESAASLDEPLERNLLTWLEHIAGGRQEDHAGEPSEFRIIEARRVLGRFDLDGASENLTHAFDADRNGCVAKPRCLGKHQHAERGLLFGLTSGSGVRRTIREQYCTDDTTRDLDGVDHQEPLLDGVDAAGRAGVAGGSTGFGSAAPR